ncbi:hypothetical protein BH09BAC3_BH09BAC3_36200 [soil metagenome]
MLYRFLSIVFILLMASCIKQEDYDLNSVVLAPDVAIPIASGDIGVLDLAADVDSAYLRSYSDGLLYFSYSRTYASREIRARFDLPANYSSTASFDLIPGSLPPSSTDTQFGSVNKEIDFGFTPAQLSEMLMKGGTVNYTVSTSPATSPALPLQVNITMTDVVQKTSLQPLVFSSGQGTGSMPLKDYLIKMSQNRFNVKLDLILKPRSSAVFVPVGTKVNIRFTFNNDFSYIKGFFGDQIVSIPTQTIDLTVFSSALKKARVSFVNPVVKVALTNEYVAPCEFNFTSLVAKKESTIIPFQLNPLNPFTLGVPANLGGSAKTDIAVTNANSIITAMPTQIVYTGSARINKGLGSGINYMADTSRLRISVITELPLYGQFSNFILSDTVKIDLARLDASTVATAALRIKALNQMPLDANIQIYLTDANYHVVDSIFSPNQTYLVKASAVMPSGELLSQGVNDQSINLLPEKVNKIFSSTYLILKSRFNTAKDANGDFLNVKFKSSYKLKMNVGLLAKLNITAK